MSVNKVLKVVKDPKDLILNTNLYYRDDLEEGVGGGVGEPVGDGFGEGPVEAVAAVSHFFAADVGGNLEFADAGGTDTHGGSAGSDDCCYRLDEAVGDVGDCLSEVGHLLHGVDYLLDGVGGVECAVIQLGAGLLVVDAIHDEAHKLLDINACFDGVFTSGIGEFMTFDCPVEACEVAVFALAEYHSGAHDGQTAVGGIALLPSLMYLLRHKFRYAVCRIGSRQGILLFQLLRGSVGRDAGCEHNMLDAVTLGKCHYIFRSAYVGLKILVVFVPGGAVHSGEVEDDVISRGCEWQIIYRLADVALHVFRLKCLSVTHSRLVVFDHGVRCAGLYDVEVVYFRIRIELSEQVGQMCADESGAAGDDIVHI